MNRTTGDLARLAELMNMLGSTRVQSAAPSAGDSRLRRLLAAMFAERPDLSEQWPMPAAGQNGQDAPQYFDTPTENSLMDVLLGLSSRVPPMREPRHRRVSWGRLKAEENSAQGWE